MKKIIILFSLVFLFFGFGNNLLVLAEDFVDVTPPTVTSYTLNGSENNVVFNPNDPASVEIFINTDESVKFNYIYICTELDEVCNGTTRIKEFTQTSFNTSVTKVWDGKKSPATAGIAPGGIYKIKIKIVDEANNETITVLSPYTVTVDTSEKPVEDTTLPIITLSGETTLNLYVGDTYEDAIVTALDDIDGDLTSSIVKNGSVDTSVVGTYTVTYDVKDLAGNSAEQVVRTINVSENSTGGDTDPIPFSIEGNVTLDGGCTIEDTNGVIHTFPNETSSSELLGVCALVVAKQDGLIEDFEFIDFGWGLFLESINGIKTGDNWDPSWSLYHNGESASVGLTDLSVKNGDTISLIFTSFNDNKEYDKVVLHILHDEEIEENPSSGGGSGGGGGGSNNEKDFSVEKAISFLSLQEEKDESLGGDMYLDWVSIAVGAEGDSFLKKELINYLKSNSLNSEIITDNERRAMALMSLGINPYNGTEVDYINKVVESFDGIQLDDNSLSDINDDIFGLIVLQNAGYEEEDEIVEKIIEFIVDNQERDGSWGSIDMTAAAIMALSDFEDVTGVSDAISDAEDYLIELQDKDGGFDNSFSTSWVIQALSLNDSYDDEVKDAIDYLGDEQQADGGLGGGDINSRVWATAYAIPAVLELSWNDILNEFSKPEEIESPATSWSIKESDDKKEVVIPKDLVLETTTLAPIKSEAQPLGEVIKKDIKKMVSPETNEEVGDEIITQEETENIPTENLLANAGKSPASDFISGTNIIVFIGVIIAIFLGGFVIKKILIQ